MHIYFHLYSDLKSRFLLKFFNRTLVFKLKIFVQMTYILPLKY